MLKSLDGKDNPIPQTSNYEINVMTPSMWKPEQKETSFNANMLMNGIQYPSSTTKNDGLFTDFSKFGIQKGTTEVARSNSFLKPLSDKPMGTPVNMLSSLDSFKSSFNAVTKDTSPIVVNFEPV